MMLPILVVVMILGSPTFVSAQIRDLLGEPASAAAADAVDHGLELAATVRWDGARRAFETAIKWQPGLAVAHFNLGVALGVLDRGEEAIAAYRETLKLSPGMTEALVNLGIELCRRNKPNEAMASLERAVRLAPRFAPAQYNLGVILLDLGRTEDAVAAFERAAKLAPSDAAIRSALVATRAQLARRYGVRRLASAATNGAVGREGPR